MNSNFMNTQVINFTELLKHFNYLTCHCIQLALNNTTVS